MPYDLFLMKVWLKKKICRSREQCIELRQHPSASQKKKKKKKKEENANIAPKTRIQIHTKKSVPACGLII